MSFSFLPQSTDPAVLQVARVRNHIPDTGNDAGTGGVEGTDYFLSDERIALFLMDESDDTLSAANVAKMAAALALDTLASNEAYVQKVQTTLEDQSDGAKTADSIRAHAKSLRQQVAVSRQLDTERGLNDTSFAVQRTRGGQCMDENSRPWPCGYCGCLRCIC